MEFPSIDPSDVGTTGLLWLLVSYGYILYYASNLISEGSDLLMAVPSMAGLVGGVVLPILGAVPDGAIMLFSGLGTIDKSQETFICRYRFLSWKYHSVDDDPFRIKYLDRTGRYY